MSLEIAKQSANNNLIKLTEELREIIGTHNVLSQPEDLAVYECDAETLDLARPDLVVLPGNTSEVAQIVKLANQYQIPFTPRGAGTGLSGGATAIMGGISIVLTRMTKILSIDPIERYAMVQAGATNLSITQAAVKYGLHYAPDPSSQAASTIGGNIAENAGGPHTLKYGLTVDHILGLTVVLPNGEITKFGGKTFYQPGLDWLGIFIGSEGTLGLATEVTVHLSPIVHSTATLTADFADLALGAEAVSQIIEAGIIPAAMEMIDHLTLNAVEDWQHLGLNRQAEALLIIELDGSELEIVKQKTVVEKILQAKKAISITWAKDSTERAKIWRARKSAFGALGRIAPQGYVLDGVIPRSKLAQAINEIKVIARKYNLLIANIYHAGDGNLHPCLLYHQNDLEEAKKVLAAGQEILALCVQLGGTLSGEHGIGIEKLDLMAQVFSAKELETMGYIKKVFNANELCNPGKILPTLKLCGESGARPLLRHIL